MTLNKDTLKLFFNYGVGVFPLFLLVGPVVSELFLILIIIFASIIIFNDKEFKYINRYFIFLVFFIYQHYFQH